MQQDNMKVIIQNGILWIRLESADGQNCINTHLVRQMSRILDERGGETKIVVLEGNGTNFCIGADLEEQDEGYHPEHLYNLWQKLAEGDFITVSHVQGKVIAGGMGFIGASDVVISDINATFSMTELMFGIYPALVLPFLIRKSGFGLANYMAVSLNTLTAPQAAERGIIDVYGAESKKILGRHLGRMSKLPKSGIRAYKEYVRKLVPLSGEMRQAAVRANMAMFQDEGNKKRIRDFVELGKFPWELWEE